MATRKTQKPSDQDDALTPKGSTSKPLAASEQVAPKKPAPRKPRAPKTAEASEAAKGVQEEKSPQTGAKKALSAAKSGTAATRRTIKSAAQGEKKPSTPRKTAQRATPKKDEPPMPPPEEKPQELPVSTSTEQEIVASAVPISFPEAEKRNLVGRALSLLLVLAILGAAVLIFFFRPNAYDEKSDAINFLYKAESDTTLITMNGTVLDEVDGACEFSSCDARGDTCAAIIGGKLYLIDKREVSELASEVNDCVLSSNGRALAWRTQNANLYYLVIGKKDGQFHMSSRTSDAHYALSPDGKELFYTYRQDDVLRIDVYSRTGTKPYLSDNQGYYPVAIANNCRYLYYTDEEGRLYVLSTRDDAVTLCCEMPDPATLLFNRDHTELLVLDGDEPRLFVDGARYILPEMGDTNGFYLQANRRVAVLPSQVGARYMMDSFLDNYYLHDTGSELRLVYLEKDKEGAAMTLCSPVDDMDCVTVTDKGVFFLQTEQGQTATHTNLYRCRPGKTQKKALCWDVQRYKTNVDGSRILYADVHGALFSMRVGGDPQRLCDTLAVESLTVTADDTFYFYRAEGELMACDNGEAPRVLATDVDEFFVDGMTLYYFVGSPDVGYTVYSNYRNMRKGTMIAQGVS